MGSASMVLLMNLAGPPGPAALKMLRRGGSDSAKMSFGYLSRHLEESARKWSRGATSGRIGRGAAAAS